jgi:Ubiquitin 3 binding protein But2 C-terminal domain
MKLLDLAAAAFSLLTLVHAVPVPQIPSGPNILSATTISQYSVYTGAIDFDTPSGKIFKTDGPPPSSDITTLVTFDLPAASAGQTCAFHFNLAPGSTLTGSGLFDVFTSLQPATESTTTSPPGNQRNKPVGRLQAAIGEATYVSDIPNSVQSFPCPSGTWAIELVGVYDTDDIKWNGSISGPYVLF